MVRPHSVESGDCSARDVRSGEWLRGSGSTASARAWRDHLRGCDTCREAFVADVARLSELTRGSHAERVRRQKAQRRAQQRRLALAGAFDGTWNRLRGARLRLLLLPALAIFLVTMLSRPPGSAHAVHAQALGGSVWLSGTSLAVDGAPRALLRGEGCATGADGAARLGSPQAGVELQGAAQAWLESHAPARFRLGAGRFTLRGDLTATTRWGVIECSDALVRALVLPDAVEFELLEGRARCIDRSGERELGRGERMRLE
jgi:hypothetical protein